MAKKKTEPEPVAEAGPSLASVLRMGLERLGVDASEADVRAWIGREYPNLKFNDGTLGSTLSTQRKKMREKLGPVVPVVPAGAPTLEDLRTVARIAADHGGTDALLELVAKVDDLAKKVGGIERLRACLAGLKEVASLVR